jgi:hypothetical protein
MDVQQWLFGRLSGQMAMFGSVHFLLLIFEGQGLLLGNFSDTSLSPLPTQIFVVKKY